MTLARTYTHVIYDGDDLARLDALRLDGKIAEHDALLAEAETRAVRVTLRSLGRAWRDLVDQHPPREGHKDDAERGVNESTFREALIRASIADIANATVDELLTDATDAEVDTVYQLAFLLNRSRGASPKALSSSDSPSES